MLKAFFAKMSTMKGFITHAVVPVALAGTIFATGLNTSSVVPYMFDNPCEGYSVSSSGGGSLDGVWREVYGYFASAGFGDAAIAGILGNIKAEGGGDPALDAGVARGFFMFDNGGAWPAYSAYAKAKGKPWQDAKTQCEFVAENLSSALDSVSGRVRFPYSTGAAVGWPVKLTLEDFKGISDAEDAAAIFCQCYERPSIPRLDRRKSFAKEFYSQIKSGSGSSKVKNVTATPLNIKDGKSTPASEKLAATAESHSNGLGANSCAAWVRQVHEEAGLSSSWKRAAGAYQSMQLYKAAGMLHTEMNHIPRGAVVFGSGSGSPGAAYGHVGIYLGNGMVIDQGRAGTSGQNIATWVAWQKAVNAGGERGWIGWTMSTEGATGDFSATTSRAESTGFSNCGSSDDAESVSDVPYYNQADAPWGSMSFWDGSVASAGCGICSLSAGISGLLKQKITPDKLIPSAMNGRSPVGLKYAQEKWGIQYQQLDKTTEAYTDALKSGKMILITVHTAVKSGEFNRPLTGGHFMLLHGYNNGKCKIMDSSGYGRAFAGKDCIKISDAVKWDNSSQPPYAFWK